MEGVGTELPAGDLQGLMRVRNGEAWSKGRRPAEVTYRRAPAGVVLKPLVR
jgi:hypothetical protein